MLYEVITEGREIRDQEVVRIDYTELIQRIESEIEKSFTDPAMVHGWGTAQQVLRGVSEGLAARPGIEGASPTFRNNFV